MKLTLLLFASLKDAAGTPQVEIQLPEKSTVSDLQTFLAETYPKLAPWLPHTRVAVNQEYISTDTGLKDGDEIALIPPVSGGQANVPLVAVVDRPLGLDEVVNAVQEQSRGACGAICTFLGVVRRTSKDPDGATHDDIEVLDYEAYAPMAEKVLRAICAEAAEQWGAIAAVTHCTGRLKVGEASVAIAVATPHRAESFEACRYIIEELKKRAPIWKKETAHSGHWWSEGSSGA